MSQRRRDFLGSVAGAGALAAFGGCGANDARVDAPDATAGADAHPNAPDADPSACTPTTSDALGPFFEPGAPQRSKIAADDEPGERLVLEGVVLSGDDCTTPIAGALLDVWQADATGGYHDAGADYRLRGQILTDANGRFAVDTIRPGNYEISPGATRPAHIHFTASAPGFSPVTTQLYFAGDPFLPPNDGCTTCGSDDPDRIVDLTGNAKAGWQGSWTVILARAR